MFSVKWPAWFKRENEDDQARLRCYQETDQFKEKLKSGELVPCEEPKGDSHDGPEASCGVINQLQQDVGDFASTDDDCTVDESSEREVAQAKREIMKDMVSNA